MLFIAAYQKKIETNNMKTDDSNSIQKSKIHADSNMYWNKVGKSTNIYSDDDYTGSDRRRPELTNC